MYQPKTSPPRPAPSEPLAIVGMACRFPGGVATLDDYWALMAEGRDGIREIPADRLDIDKFYDPRAEAPGKIFVRHGGFLEQSLDAFDAEYFGMSPREAAYLDPQQRLLMEVAFEAIEDAGIPADKLRGSNTGVFIGGFMVDGMLTQFSPLGRDAIGQHSAVSSTLTILSNRISYLLDLHGPSFTLDTACSSSLVAMHQGCQALRHGECDLVMVGGVNVIFRPETLIAMCKGGFLSRDGRSKSFDARADGYGRGEGAGMVLVKRLSDAQAAGDRIHAVIRGSGVNQDGRTDGITQPNGDAQADLIRAVCTREEIDPAGITYVEAHGTGTAIGDPIELRALGRVFGSARKAGQDPCLVGSVKANIGHLEAAAGIAAVIKTALCLKKGMVPPVANLETVNPALDLAGWRLDLPRALAPLPALPNGQRGRAAINSFGYGGTNASLIMEAPPETAAAPARAAAPSTLLLISARSTDALRDLAARYRDRLAGLDAQDFADLCHSAARRRSQHEYRLVVVAADAEAAAAALDDFVEGRENPDVVKGFARRSGEAPVFVFTGMGPQWWGMGRDLLAADPVFSAAAEEIDARFKGISGWSILDELARPEAESRVTKTEIAQPANFLIQTALMHLLRSMGVDPAAVVGHSVGEVSSAHAAGVLSLEDALRVSHLRAKLQATTAGQGAMLAVGLSPAAAASYLAGHEALVSIGAANGPASITLAGDAAALEDIAARLTDDGIFNRMLQVETAYHSPVMDPLLDPLEAGLQGIAPQPATLPLYSTVTAMQAEDEDFGAAYWRHNVRDCVRFADTVREMIDDGHECFLEVGPHPVLGGSLRECLLDANVEGVTAMTLRRGQPERQNILRGIAQLHVAGVVVDWARFFDTGSYVPLPAYPWQRRSFWSEGDAARADRLGTPDEATLLGAPQSAPAPLWRASFNRNRMAYVLDHRVEGSTVLPGAAYVEIALELAAALQGPLHLSDLSFSQALLIGDLDEISIQTGFDTASRRFAIHSTAGTDWTLHATGRVSSREMPAPLAEDMPALRARITQGFGTAAHYAGMDARGLQYGPAFRGIAQIDLSHDRTEVLARVETPASLQPRGEVLHPALLDACFQALISMLPDSGDPVAYVPVRIEEIVVHARPHGTFTAHGTLVSHDAHQMQADLRLLADDGTVLVELGGIHARSLGANVEADVDHLITRFEMERQDLPAGSAATGAVLLMDREGHGRALAAALGASIALAIVEDGQPMQDADHVIDLRALSEHGEDPVGTQGAVDLLATLQSMPQDGKRRRYSLVLPTRAGQPSAVALDCAARLGLMRVAANEYADMDIRMIQIDGSAATQDRLSAELLSATDEDDVVLTADARFVRRLKHIPAARIADEALARRKHGTGMEVEVIAAFQSATASDVLALTPDGRRVLLRHDGAAPRFVHVQPEATVTAPEGMDDAETLAMLPVAIADAMLARAGLEEGQTVVIHPAGGDLARALAVAATLRGAVLAEVPGALQPARSLPRIDLLCLTAADDLARALFPAMAGGTVLDLGGADLPIPADLTLLRLDPRAVRICSLGDAMGRIAGKLPRTFVQGRGAPLRHVIGQSGPAAEMSLLRSAPVPVIRADGTYLVTGGFGGFGFEIAKWLAAKGAGTIALAGRKGADTPRAQEMMDQIAALGSKAIPLAVDMADALAVAQMVETLGPDLRGIFHAAGILDDAPVYLLNAGQIDRVMQPKALGAWNLHQATLDHDLDAFVAISSIASLLGSPGQGSYAAANTFLDALVRHRRLAGRPGIAINLGALAEVGMAARHDGVEKHFARVGVGSLKPAEAIGMLDRILGWNPVNLAAAPMDWALWGETYRKWAASPRYRHLVPERSAAQAEGVSLADMTPEERTALVEATLRELVGSVLRLPADAIDVNRSLLNMGVDSLMAMELQAVIDRRLGLKVPTLELMKGVAFAALARNVAAMVDTAPPPAPVKEAPRTADMGELLARLEQMSPEEIERSIALLEVPGE
ncbi:type I polyketide synthase [Falsirhodobacter xinxiangensis]|uniref:type I polyketide synthase n=1 Tax=Falsirhodobacter xinxiangensis TaxID=2530049 RepID=UPI0010AB0569|nr:type I polyketide synthase [Rhodobacter xinxiangensis]